MTRHSPLIHLHISKTAGSTIRKMLAKHHLPENLYRVDGYNLESALDAYVAMSAEMRARIACVYGHMPFGFHLEAGVPPRYLTMLRDPVERVNSHYHFVRVRPRAALHASVIEGRVSLAEYVSVFSASRFVNNGQVRCLGATQMCAMELPGPGALERAKERLVNGEIMFGLVERFDESMQGFSRSEAWALAEAPPQKVNPEKPPLREVEAEVRGLIAETNSLDVELYRFACEEFDRRARDQAVTEQA